MFKNTRTCVQLKIDKKSQDHENPFYEDTQSDSVKDPESDDQNDHESKDINVDGAKDEWTLVCY